MHVVNCTELDPQTMHRFAVFQLNGKRTFNRIMAVTISVLVGIVFLCALYLGIFFSDPTAFVYGAVMLAILGVWFVLKLHLKKKMENNYASRGISAIRYLFEDDGFGVETISAGAQISERIRYTALTRICETDEDFYLKIGLRGWYIVSKRGFSDEGGLCDLRIRFSSLLGKKYSIVS